MDHVFHIPVSMLTIDPEDHGPFDIGHLFGLLAGRIHDRRPLTVEPTGPGVYKVINGRHRYVLALLTNTPTVPATTHQH